MGGKGGEGERGTNEETAFTGEEVGDVGGDGVGELGDGGFGGDEAREGDGAEGVVAHVGGEEEDVDVILEGQLGGVVGYVEVSVEGVGFRGDGGTRRREEADRNARETASRPRQIWEGRKSSKLRVDATRY